MTLFPDSERQLHPKMFLNIREAHSRARHERQDALALLPMGFLCRLAEARNHQDHQQELLLRLLS